MDVGVGCCWCRQEPDKLRFLKGEEVEGDAEEVGPNLICPSSEATGEPLKDFILSGDITGHVL